MSGGNFQRVSINIHYDDTQILKRSVGFFLNKTETIENNYLFSLNVIISTTPTLSLTHALIHSQTYKHTQSQNL